MRNMTDRCAWTVDPAAGGLPHHLLAAIRDVYAPAGMNMTEAAQREEESSEYGACRLGLEGHAVAFRVAKTTPTKIGQFVTIWNRATPGGRIAPLDSGDDVDFVVVSVFDATHQGQFVFDKKVLVAKGVMSVAGKGGKRAIRVYPPWTQPVAKEAAATQRWQLPYFLPFAPDGTADAEHVRRLYAVRR